MAEGWTLVTGASKGIGKELARIAAREGHALILSARSKDQLEALAEELRTAHGGEVVVIVADLTRADAAADLWRAASAGRRIDILVNNAGLGRNGAFAEAGWARELASINVNITALTELMKRAVVDMLAAGGGQILNLASTAAFMPGPGMAVYHATKSYVLSLSEAVSEELRGTPVSVTALCPGATATHFFADAEMESMALLRYSKPPSAESVARVGWRAMKAGKRAVVPGAMNKAFAFLPRLVPIPLASRITAKFLAKAE